MLNWEPISEAALLDRIAQGVARMPVEHRQLWDAIRIVPGKWQQHPYGDEGGGFWAVGVIGRSVIWYNDIENGFNRSIYSTHGVIDDYWRNDDELHTTIEYLVNVINFGRDLTQLGVRFRKRK